jgi:hypothetical protein
VLQAGVFAEDWDVKEWFKNGIVSWNTNWEKDSCVPASCRQRLAATPRLANWLAL